MVVSTAAPIFTIPIENAFVDVGQTAVFRCYATGVPNVRYRWFANATALHSAMLPPADRARYSFSTSGNILTITDVHTPDAGMYQCEATNAHGTKLCSAELRIFGKLRLIHVVQQTRILACTLNKYIQHYLINIIDVMYTLLAGYYDGYPTFRT